MRARSADVLAGPIRATLTAGTPHPAPFARSGRGHRSLRRPRAARQLQFFGDAAARSAHSSARSRISTALGVEPTEIDYTPFARSRAPALRRSVGCRAPGGDRAFYRTSARRDGSGRAGDHLQRRRASARSTFSSAIPASGAEAPRPRTGSASTFSSCRRRARSIAIDAVLADPDAAELRISATTRTS